MYSLLLGLLTVGTLAVDRESLERGAALCSAYGYTLVEGRFGEEQHLLCLKMEPIHTTHLATKGIALYLDPDPEQFTGGLRRAQPLEGVALAYGFPVLRPRGGSAEGYVGEDHQFYGVLHLGNRTLHADPYGTDDPSKTFGVFEHDNVLPPMRARRDYAQSQFSDAFTKITFPFHIEQRPRRPGSARARICDLLLLADKEFYERDANSSLNHVVSRMMHAVAQADIIFRNADFNEDGVPDNIGFSVKYILVLTSDETNTRVFGNLLQQRSVNGRSYLMRFARLRRLSEVCLGVAFSGHSFYNRTLGLSFTSLGGGVGGAAGGLCDRRAYGRSFNTLALAHATTGFGLLFTSLGGGVGGAAGGLCDRRAYGRSFNTLALAHATGGGEARVPERIAALTLAHELGHSFGAHHDDSFPNPECRGYLMGAQSSAATNSSHHEFSVCSKRLVAATLGSMSYCLAERDEPYCGNGIVEEGEACDCGLPSRCADRDPCCTPRAGGALQFEEGALHKAGCEVAPGAMCHPSQGPCCNTECQYANLSKEGIDCKNMGLECSCNRPECRCGLGGRCLTDRSCHAAECVALGLRECQCEPKSMVDSGNLEEPDRCRACCLLPGITIDRCMPAEEAGRELATKRSLPRLWIDQDYKGPNLTIKVCPNCSRTLIRAWPYNDYCVTRNMIGVCGARAVCQLGQLTPRSNIYPHVMLAKLKSQEQRKSASPTDRVIIAVVLIPCFTTFVLK